MNRFKRWLKDHDLELRAHYREYRLESDYSTAPVVSFRRYCLDLFARGGL